MGKTDEIVSIRRIANYCGMSTVSVWRWNNIIPAGFKFRGLIARISKTNLELWLRRIEDYSAEKRNDLMRRNREKSKKT